MDEKKYLFEELEAKAYRLRLPYPEIPKYISDNLRFNLFEWQEKALLNFLIYEAIKGKEQDKNPSHLLFNMATGTGKTLLMAALILYYYKNGYRHFIFFVNQNNIVGKTEENLINPSHNKYLFQPNISIDDKTIRIKKVETFSNRTDDIQILFTSIHKLHNAIYLEKENNPTLNDLQKKNIVLLGDEAHHLNADTKKKKGEQEELELQTEIKEGAGDYIIEKSWEHTVIKRILHKDKKSHSEKNGNVLLEFTATVPKNKSVAEKYLDKTIIQFPLKDFLKAGYTKEINLVSSNFDLKKRILQALLFNWFRHKIADKNGIANFKPVILFRSKFIENSEEDYKYFVDLVKNLKSQDFSFIDEIKEEGLFNVTELYEKGNSRIIDIKRFITEEKISIKEIIEYIQYYFSEKFCIVTNSKDKTAKGERGGEKTTDDQNKLLNSLEDKNNHLRAIFTVKRLTEGWDVLNLFDIVRLYEGRDERKKTETKGRQAGEATTSEVQLIGRGVRYFPFEFEDKQKNKRKFDNHLAHELRVLEEFYYHSDSDERYIDELKRELKNKGYIDDKKKVKHFFLKDDFKKEDFYQTVKLFLNEQIDNPNRKKVSFYDEEFKKNFDFAYEIETTIEHETRVELDKEEDTTRFESKIEDKKTIPFTLNDFSKYNKHIIRKAINTKAKKDKSIFRFQNLKEELSIDSTDKILADEFLGSFPIKITTTEIINSVNDIPNETQLKILLKFFDEIENQLKEISNPYNGSDFFALKFSDVFDGVKEKSIEETDADKILAKELVKNDWYVLNYFNGTDQEINLIEFLKDRIGNLKEKYDEFYLLRNEEVYKIFDFDKGRGFQPDFLLFLKQKNKNLYYQIFIEPKGEQFTDSSGGFKEGKEGWKEKFLLEISQKYGGNDLLKAENKDYKLIGLPLYNEKNKKDFEEKYNELL